MARRRKHGACPRGLNDRMIDITATANNNLSQTPIWILHLMHSRVPLLTNIENSHQWIKMFDDKLEINTIFLYIERKMEERSNWIWNGLLN